MVDSPLPFVRMGALPLLCLSMESASGSRRAANNTTNTRLGEDRRGRFLLLFERWLRKFHTLQHGLDRVRMQRRVYYRWKKGQVVPRESVLKRYCQAAGFDEQYVLTGNRGAREISARRSVPCPDCPLRYCHRGWSSHETPAPALALSYLATVVCRRLDAP